MKLKWIQQFIMCIGFLPLAGLTEENRLAGIFPERIRTIALVAPASPGSSTQKVDRGIALLEKSGIRVKTMPNARIGEPAGYTSIPVGKRVADLEQAWLDPEVDLILCIRGGAGTSDILERLDWDKLRTRPDLPVLGFSDITALHMAMLKEKAGHPYASPSLLALLSVILSAVVYLSLSRNIAVRYGEIVMITIAAYTFYKITAAVVRAVRQRRNPSPLLAAIRGISYAEVAASVLTLQRSMLVSFGAMSAGNIHLMNALTGAGVCLFVLLLGISMIIKGRKGEKLCRNQSL